jgi:uncharacterized protein YgbK (DUF1537 family)
MPRPPLIVLADDLTGAAELAAIAHENGRRAMVFTNVPRDPVDADVLVFSTDTRLLTAAQAARRVKLFSVAAKQMLPAGIFKKVDSVLRGPVIAEAEACAKVFGFDRVVLVPANPSLGRIIRNGSYFVDGLPLHHTAFAHDPHHPASSPDVQVLLGLKKKSPPVCFAPADPLPARGVFVGETGSGHDIIRWAQRSDATTLPAGGADFFRAWLNRRSGLRRRQVPHRLPAGPALLLHGTTSTVVQSGALLFSGRRPPSKNAVAEALRRGKSAIVAASQSTARDSKSHHPIAAGFAQLVRALQRADEFRHLLITGGATAGAVLSELGWSGFEVSHVWGSGAVTLRPTAAPDFAVTLKPGSYPWPAKLRRAVPRIFPS